MIDMERETLVTLTQATGLLPRRRRGRGAHVSTLYRWATVGLRGVRLEVLRVGGTLCTSREAIQRSCEQLTSLDTASADGRSPRPAPAISLHGGVGCRS